MKKMPEPRKKT